jgi:hypothetical protein
MFNTWKEIQKIKKIFTRMGQNIVLPKAKNATKRAQKITWIIKICNFLGVPSQIRTL